MGVYLITLSATGKDDVLGHDENEEVDNGKDGNEKGIFALEEEIDKRDAHKDDPFKRNAQSSASIHPW